MVHFNISPQMSFHEDQRPVHNPPCQHAFIMVGTTKAFGVHMTQYHCEKHKYQLIMEVDFPTKGAMEEYRLQREMYPEDTFILSNRIEDKYSIPQLGGGIRTEFVGALYRGFRPPNGPTGPDWFPWNDDDCIPVIDKIKVKVKRIVQFRPFSHTEIAPDTALYYLWGTRHGDLRGAPSEAHMTNIQHATLLTGPHEPPLYGLDHDHVMSLKEVPEWISDDMLTAGVMVSVPGIARKDPETGKTVLLAKPPFEPKDVVALMYRGIQPPRHVVAGQTFLWSSVVNNSEELVAVTPNMGMIISPMPEKYWK